MTDKIEAALGTRPLLRWGWGLIVLMVVVTSLLYGTFAWRPPEPEQPLKVAIGIWPGSETLIYARESGLLSKDEAQLVEMAWSSATKVTFVNRVVDAAVVSLDEVLRLRDGGVDVRVVMVFGFSTGGDALLARPTIQRLEDLRGRRIGVETKSTGYYLLATALEKVHMSLRDVQPMPLNVAEMEAAYLGGEVDAVVTGEPWTTRLLGQGAVNLFDSGQMPKEVCRVLVVRTEALEQRQDQIRHLVAAHFTARDRLYQGGDEKVMEIISRRLGFSRTEYDQCLSRMKLPDLAENVQLLGGDSPHLQRLAARISVKMERYGLVRDAAPTSEWMTADCLEEAP